MTHERLELGEAGEKAAAEHLAGLGYRILAHRWRAAGREIDLVAVRNGILALVEVKTRRSGTLAAPAMAVDWRKQRQLTAAAHAAMARWGQGRAIRFDVVSVIRDYRGRLVLDHLEDAFRPR